MPIRRWLGPRDTASDSRQPSRRGLALPWRLVLLVLASILPLLIFILGYEYFKFSEDVAATGQQTLTRARGVAMLVEEQLRARIAALQALAVSPALRDGDLESFRDQAETVLTEQFPGAAILVLRPDGQVLMSTRAAPGAELPVRPHLGSLEQVLATGQPAISDLFIGELTQRPVVAIDVPVKTRDGAVSYVLSLNPRLDVFADLIQNERLPDGWVASIFDRGGVNVARVPHSDRFVGQKASQSLLGPLLKEREGIVKSTSLEGIPLMSAFSRGNRFGWAVGIGVPQAELTAPIVQNIARTSAVGIVLLLASITFAFVAARHITGPIQSLRRLAGLSDREPLSPPAPTGVPEVDEVAQALHAREEERRRSREAEAILRDGIETIPEGFSIYDADDRVVMCNKAYRELFAGNSDYIAPGARYEDILRNGMARGHYDVPESKEEEWIAARVRDHRAAQAASELELSDGRWVLSTKRRLSNGWTAGLRIDITAIKRAQTALAMSERRFQDFAEVSGDWLWETDAEHRFTLIAGDRTDSTPIHSDDVIGKTRWEIAGGDPDTDETWSQHKRDLDAHRPFRHFAYKVRIREGTEMFVSASGKPVFNDDGRFIGYRGTATDETALVLAARRAEAAETLLRDAIESISGGFLISDADDRIVLFNQGMREYYPDCHKSLTSGNPYQDFLRARLRNGYYPQAAGREEEWLAEAMARHRSAANELEIPLKDGRWLFVTERRMSNGGIAGVSLDISALKAAEDARRHSEEQFRRFFEISPDLIVVTDRSGTLLRVSPSVQPMLGYDPDELVGCSGTVLVHPEDLDATQDQMRRARREGTVRNFECRYLNKQGQPVTLWWAGAWSASEQQHFFMGRDITDRKVTERRLRESEEQLKRAQRLAHMGSDTRDLQTDETMWSDETYRIFGVSRETFVPTTENFLALVHPDDRERIDAAREQLLLGITPAPFEYRITRPDGIVRHIYREAEMVKDENGKPLYMLGAIHDVTERRQTEAQLRQAQKMEAIGNLTGGMAHDFNNLLGVIVGNLGMAVERLTGDPDAEEMVRDSLEAAWRGADLTRRLLAFARRQPLRPTKIDVNDLVTDTTRLLRRLLGADIEVRLDLSADLWSVIADPAQLEAGLANLATNARDAMPAGGRLIIATANRHLDTDYVATHAEASEGDFVMIEVSDTGAGMPAAVMSQIFEPFFTTKEAGKGTGLGLSMVFGFLRQSGGHVSVYSEPGVGTTFRLYLPRSTSDAVAVEDAPKPVVERGAGETVLVVEDDPIVRRTVLRQLSDLDYTVLESERAAEALEMLQREQVDLVFTDIVMPGGLDGVELARLARERWPDLKIVLTSGFPQARIDLADAPLRNLRLISKPYSKEELAAVLRATLSE